MLVGRSAARPGPIAELEELGAEVLALEADVTDVDAMRRVRAAAEERFGAVHGVIHAAGVPPGGMLQLKTRENWPRCWPPRWRGALVLEEVFGGADLDFLMLFSSLTSILGAFGLVDLTRPPTPSSTPTPTTRTAGVSGRRRPLGHLAGGGAGRGRGGGIRARRRPSEPDPPSPRRA